MHARSAWEGEDGVSRPGREAAAARDTYLDGQESKDTDDKMISRGMAISSLHPDNPFHPDNHAMPAAYPLLYAKKSAQVEAAEQELCAWKEKLSGLVRSVQLQERKDTIADHWGWALSFGAEENYWWRTDAFPSDRARDGFAVVVDPDNFDNADIWQRSGLGKALATSLIQISFFFYSVHVHLH